MNRNMIAKLLLAAAMALPWLAASSGCVRVIHEDRGWHRDWDDRGEHHDWDDRRDDRRVYDPYRDRD